MAKKTLRGVTRGKPRLGKKKKKEQTIRGEGARTMNCLKRAKEKTIKMGHKIPSKKCGRGGRKGVSHKGS